MKQQFYSFSHNKMATAPLLMQSIKPLYFVLLFLISIEMLQGQSNVSLYPVRFSQYYNCFPIINPAMAGSVKDVELQFGHKRLSKQFGKNATYYLNANVRLIKAQHKRNSPYSVLGLLVYNDREGNYLNRSRFYITYAWHANLTQNLKFSGGIDLGGMNYFVKGTELSGYGSSTAADGAVGMQFYNTIFHVGIAFNQIFNTKLQPIDEVSHLNTSLELSGSIKIKLSENAYIKPFYTQHFPLKDDRGGDIDRKYGLASTGQKIDADLMFVWRDKLAITGGIHSNNKIINSIEFRNFLAKERGLNLCFTYGYPYGSVERVNFFEIGISYLIDRKQHR